MAIRSNTTAGKPERPAGREVKARRSDERDGRRADHSLEGVGARLLPAEESSDAHEKNEEEAERLQPRLVELRADGDLVSPVSASLMSGNVVATRMKNRTLQRIQLLRTNVNSREKIDSI